MGVEPRSRTGGVGSTRGWPSTPRRRRRCAPRSCASPGSASSASDDEDGDPSRPRADRRLLAPLAAAGVDPTGAPLGARGRRRGRDARALRGAPARPRTAPLIHECLSAIADEAGYLIVVSDADGMLLTHRGLRARAPARRRRHELRRGHAVERGRAPARTRSAPRSPPTTPSRSSAPSTSTSPSSAGPARPRRSTTRTPAS